MVDLEREGFSPHVLTALAAVTKVEGEPYAEFVLRAAANPIGRAVKLADLRDNSDLSRIATPTAHDYDRVAKYQRAIAMLEALRPIAAFSASAREASIGVHRPLQGRR